MDIELRKILDEVYANRMKPDEAQWKICVLFNVSNSFCSCKKPQQKASMVGVSNKCSKCGKNIEQNDC